MESRYIGFKLENGIATVLLDSPDNYNAMSEELLRELNEVLDKCAADGEVKVLIIGGEGRAFSAGGDIKSMRRGIVENQTDMLPRIVREASRAARKLRQLPKPVIAAVHGAAAGAGMSLALLCDFRVVAEDVRFIEAFVNLGLVPDMGGTFILSRYVGVGRLTDYLMTGRPMSAAEALELGVVNSVVPRDNLMREATELATRLAAQPTQSLAYIKDLINRALFADFDLSLEKELEYQGLLAETDNYREAVTAFLEKRPAVFNKRS